MIVVLAATGMIGRKLVEKLCDAGHDVLATGRTKEKLSTIDKRAQQAYADLQDPSSLKPLLKKAKIVICCAHGSHAETIIPNLPKALDRLILMGSTRVFTKLPDPQADAVRQALELFNKSKVPGIMLLPSMIYGSPQDRNINRILSLVQQFPFIPLPNGGKAFVQPVFVDDVIEALFKSVSADLAKLDRTITVAGPEPIPYSSLVKTCGNALNRKIHILPVPISPLSLVAKLLKPLGMTINQDELVRATENKSYDVTPLRQQLGITPISFEDGLNLKIQRGWYPRKKLSF
ncbi:MAG: NAD(P)H-binding protein [Alphaproteobacteria bacterium]|jgi:nucleoside-diphosphate-sugar epimerase|nr:NAD(P)H-binding protein [Alphaproteobacteria bacterium]MBT5389156.1 NAD(P)H-binding protein [Alphaproteobacteria bacterium]MBT5540203.1 NAD(P)H-binding protein [Alphaproteobacteria bacterium]MBT5654402.1 NAD(P)H-binding protein [Alphaproteobacteria bacterium]